MSSHGLTCGDVNLMVAVRSSEHDDRSSDAEERRTELPVLAPMSARRRRHASWPPTAADAARAARSKSRHSSRRPSPTTVVATAVVEPEPETHRVLRPETARRDRHSRRRTGTGNVSRHQTGSGHVRDGRQRSGGRTTAACTRGVRRATDRQCRQGVDDIPFHRQHHGGLGNITVVSPDTYTVDPSSSTKETTADNNGVSTVGHPGIYKKAVVPEGRARQWNLVPSVAEKSSSEPSATSAATGVSPSATLPKITASAFWDVGVLGHDSRARRAVQRSVGERASTS